MDQPSFAWWLQGWVELNGGAQPTAEQWEVIKEHLALVFTKVTIKTVPPASVATAEATKYCLGKTLDSMRAKEERILFNVDGLNLPTTTLTC